MRSLLLITRAELFKLLKRPLTWTFLLALLALLGLGFNAKVEHAQEPPPEVENLFEPGPQDHHRAVVYPGAFDQVQVAFHLPAFFLLVLTTTTVSQEFGWGTIRAVLAREPGRGRLLLAQLAALAAVTIIYLLFIWLSYAILGLWASQKLDGQITLSFFDGAFLVQQLAMLGRVWLAILPVIAFGLFVAVWARNAAIAITLGGMTYFLAWIALLFTFGLLAYGILLPAIESGRDLSSMDLGIVGKLITLSPHYNMNAVAHWGDGKMMSTDISMSPLVALDINLPHGPWRGLALLLGYSLLPLALAWRIFWRQDVTL